MARSSSASVVIHYVLPVLIVDDVMFAHKPRLLDVAAQLKRSAHAALGLVINCARSNTGCSERTGLLFERLK